MRIITGFGVIYDMATLRPEPEADERTFLYNLGDNIIGYPDDYETLGEQLKSYVGDNSYKVRNQLSLGELAKSGITSAQDMVSGFKDSVSDRGIMGALFDIPVESARSIVEGVSGLYKNEYSGPSRYDDMMVDAAKASGIGEIAKVIGGPLLAGGVPLALSRGIVGSIDDIGGPLLDRTLLDQNKSRAYDFASESDFLNGPPPTNAGQFESSNDHAVQAAIDDYNFGLSSSEYIEATSGIRIVPRTDAAGNQEGVVSAGYVFPSETFGLNIPTTAGTYKLKDLVLSTKIKNRAVFEGVDVKFEPDSTGDAGGYDIDTRTIYVNSDMSPELQLETLKHESEHLFMDAARIPSSVLGGNEAELFSYKVKRLNDLDSLLKAAKFRSEISEDNYSRLRGGNELSANEFSDYKGIGAATFKDLSSERDALNSFTAKEMYYMNPGEFFARSSEGAVTGDFIPKRLSARDLLNPFLNNVPLSRRLDEIVRGSIMPESRAVKLARRGENSPTATKVLSVFNTTPTNLASDLYHDKYAGRGATSGETRDFQMPVTAAQNVEKMRQIDRDGLVPFANGGRITGGLGSMGYML